MINIGDKLPDVRFYELSGNDVVTLTTNDIFSGYKVLVIGVVGAFTPVCGVSHLPEYIPLVNTFKDKGDVDRVVCLCAADPYTMKAWGDSLGIGPESIRMITDNNADFADRIGLSLDLSSIGLARRSNRYSMVVKNGVVETLTIEKNPIDVGVTSASSMLTALAA